MYEMYAIHNILHTFFHNNLGQFGSGRCRGPKETSAGTPTTRRGRIAEFRTARLVDVTNHLLGVNYSLIAELT